MAQNTYLLNQTQTEVYTYRITGCQETDNNDNNK